jgi:Uma2 family endonuclease
MLTAKWVGGVRYHQSMQVALPDNTASAKLILDSPEVMTEEAYFEFCQANPNLKIERTAKGEIVIAPPAGGEADYRSVEFAAELRNWAKRDGRGKVFGSSVEFLLPDGSALSPDAAWVSNGRLAMLSKAQRRQFLKLVPEFVAEVMSPSDRLPTAKAKMQDWIRNGVSLGWLIDGDAETVYIYRPGQAAEVCQNVSNITGDGPLEGFTLELLDLWAGL